MGPFYHVYGAWNYKSKWTATWHETWDPASIISPNEQTERMIKDDNSKITCLNKEVVIEKKKNVLHFVLTSAHTGNSYNWVSM